jgi:preprotein translocase subunit SecB
MEQKMSEQEKSTQPVFNIEKVYVKDSSLEVPNAPEIFLEAGQPNFEVNLATEGKRVNDTLYEIIVKVTLTAKANDKVLFLVEVSQAGIFQIRNVPETDINPVLGIACPTILFPYARESVADLVARAGFPPIHLAPVNFEGMYAARQQKQKDGPKIEIAH